MSHSTSHGRESSSRRTSKTPYDSQRFELRREKAKSSQGYAQYHTVSQQQRADGPRRGSLRPANADPDVDELGRNSSGVRGGGGAAAAHAGTSERPRLKARTNSAPLVTDRGRLTGHEQQHHRRNDDESHRTLPSATSPIIDIDGQDEDETLGVVGAIRQFHPFQTPEVCPLRDMRASAARAYTYGGYKLITHLHLTSSRSHCQKSTLQSSAPKELGSRLSSKTLLTSLLSRLRKPPNERSPSTGVSTLCDCSSCRSKTWTLMMMRRSTGRIQLRIR